MSGGTGGARVQLLARDPTVAGLRAAETRPASGSGPRYVEVWLYHDPPEDPAALSDPSRWRLVGPPGAPPVRVTDAGTLANDTGRRSILLTVEGEPSTARYRLEVLPGQPPVAFDPLRTSLLVRLRPECPDLGRCASAPVAGPLPPPSPVHDYLARDWRSLRRALLEYLRAQDPDADLSVADPTVALVELFAHAGDLLHYRLDRVATEAYLETARLRTSVRRHARLVDFRVGDGVSARTFVHLSVPPATATGPGPGPGTVTVLAGDVAVDDLSSHLAFTLESGLDAVDALGEIPLYDWGEGGGWLAAGATECVLVRPNPADRLTARDALHRWLAPGDLVVFEVVDPGERDTHRAWSRAERPWPAANAAGTPAFRVPLPSREAQVVRLSAVEVFTDPLAPAGLRDRLLRVRWRPEDALARAYPIGIDSGAGGDEVGVARANIVPAHHGRLVHGPPGTTVAPRPDDRADRSPSAWWLTATGIPRMGGGGLALDERGLPHRLDVTVTLPSGSLTQAEVLPTLLEASPGSLAVTVDIEESEPAVIRFSTGPVGMPPPSGSQIAARYEVGGGAAGNVPANALLLLERDANLASDIAAPDFKPVGGVAARNPVPAWGGADPVPLDEVRRAAPEAFSAVARRAVLAADYAAAVSGSPLVRQAMARRTWTGSWPLVTTVVDLDVGGATALAAPATAGLRAHLDGLRMLGTESAVVAGTAVGLLIGLHVCVTPGADAHRVRAQVLAALRPGTHDRPGLFHPSRLRLGGTIYVSAVVATVARVPGVDAVTVDVARRLDQPPGPPTDQLAFAADEVPVLDDDPDRPDRGRLELTLGGGR